MGQTAFLKFLAHNFQQQSQPPTWTMVIGHILRTTRFTRIRNILIPQHSAASIVIKLRKSSGLRVTIDEHTSPINRIICIMMITTINEGTV